jgi:hypothetical protein
MTSGGVGVDDAFTSELVNKRYGTAESRVRFCFVATLNGSSCRFKSPS